MQVLLVPRLEYPHNDSFLRSQGQGDCEGVESYILATTDRVSFEDRALLVVMEHSTLIMNIQRKVLSENTSIQLRLHAFLIVRAAHACPYAVSVVIYNSISNWSLSSKPDKLQSLNTLQHNIGCM